MNVEIISKNQIEDIAYKIAILTLSGWKREFVSYTESKHFLDCNDFLWIKKNSDGSFLEQVIYSHYEDDNVKTIYFTLDQAFDSISDV